MADHHMIDLETLDTQPSAVVLSIGVVAFDPHDWEITGEFHRILEIESQVNLFRTTSQSTKQWWAQQSDEARAIFDAPKTSTYDALIELAEFTIGTQGVWGNGASFDNVIISSLYKSWGLRTPWSFGLDRCHRTMKNLVMPADYVRPERLGVHHDALADARYQFNELRAICTALKLNL